VYQQAGSKFGAWLDRHVPFVKRVWKAFTMLGDIGKLVAGGATVAALFVGGSAANDALTNTASHCPSGWAYNEAINGDAVHRACYDEPWSVVLNPDNSCNYGLNTQDRDAVPTPCNEVPGWAGR
jgi:hypothetical protein